MTPAGPFNPLEMLSGIPGFSGGSATSSASGYQSNQYNAPFNVGGGSLDNTASNSPDAAAGMGAGLSEWMPVIIVGVVAWAAITLLK